VQGRPLWQQKKRKPEGPSLLLRSGGEAVFNGCDVNYQPRRGGKHKRKREFWLGRNNALCQKHVFVRLKGGLERGGLRALQNGKGKGKSHPGKKALKYGMKISVRKIVSYVRLKRKKSCKGGKGPETHLYHTQRGKYRYVCQG